MADVIALFRKLPKEKQKFVYEMVTHAEGSWGDLRYPQTRRFYYSIMRHAVSPEFAKAFEDDLEERWERAQGADMEGLGETWPGGEPISDYDRSSFAAEAAFRDFHYSYEAEMQKWQNK